VVNAAATALNGGPVLNSEKMEEFCLAPDLFNSTVLDGMTSASNSCLCLLIAASLHTLQSTK